MEIELDHHPWYGDWTWSSSMIWILNVIDLQKLRFNLIIRSRITLNWRYLLIRCVLQGNWTIKRFRMKRAGITQLLSRLSFISALGHMTKIQSQVWIEFFCESKSCSFVSLVWLLFYNFFSLLIVFCSINFLIGFFSFFSSLRKQGRSVDQDPCSLPSGGCCARQTRLKERWV